MTLTKQEAIENHRKMWNWIADELEKGNGPSYNHIADIKIEYFIKHNITPENTPRSYCYCCEYADSCGDCPLDWPSDDCVQFNNGLYKRTLDACNRKDYTEAAKLARQIANLPENPNS